MKESDVSLYQLHSLHREHLLISLFMSDSGFFTAPMTWSKDSTTCLPGINSQILFYCPSLALLLLVVICLYCVWILHYSRLSWSFWSLPTPAASLASVIFCLDLELIPHLVLCVLENTYSEGLLVPAAPVTLCKDWQKWIAENNTSLILILPLTM